MLSEQINENFIGHKQEQQIFQQWFTNPDAEAPWILFFHDKLEKPQEKGGVGKTWLLRKCASSVEAETAVAMVDFFGITDRNGAAVAEQVVQSLKHTYPFWTPSAYIETLKDYQRAQKEQKQTGDLDTALHESLAEDLKALEQFLEQVGKYLLICFDTFELIEEQPLVAVLGAVRTFPDRYDFTRIKVMIAGRNAPDWTQPNWRGREKEVLPVPVGPFDLAETAEFIEANCKPAISSGIDTNSLQAIYQRTQGRPILVSLVVDLLNEQIMKPEELSPAPTDSFENERILVLQINNIQKPINTILLFMAHVYYRFSPAILLWIFRQLSDVQELASSGSSYELEKLFERLLELSFVRRSGSSRGDNTIALHDEMRRLVNTYNWPAYEATSKVYRKDLSRAMIEYYQHELATKPAEPLRQAYIVEMLYHQLYSDFNSGFASFSQHMYQAIGLWQNAFARSLLLEVQTHQDALTPIQQDLLLYYEASLLQREENYAAALERYEQLQKQADPDWLSNQLGELLFEQGICYQELNNFQGARDCFSKSLEISQSEGTKESLSRIGRIHSRLGLIHKRLGELQLAKDSYLKGMEAYKRRGDERGYAEVLTHLSMLYRLLGELEEALDYANTALRIRRKQYALGTIASENGVGTTLTVIGVIHYKRRDMVKAQEYFEAANDIYKRNRYRTGLAEIATRFGQVAMGRRKLDEAIQWFDQAYEYAFGVNAETEINSSNKQGRAWILLKDFEKARFYLNRAIERSHQVDDHYQLVESLIDLARAFNGLKRSEEALEFLQEADNIAKSFNYNYLLSLSQLTRGESFYETGDFEKAFQHYCLFCYYAALYNPVEYEKARCRTTDDLLAIPSQKQILEMLDTLEAIWLSYKQELGERTEPLDNEIKRMRRLLNMQGI